MNDQLHNLDTDIYGPWPLQFLGWVRLEHFNGLECRWSTLAYDHLGRLVVWYTSRRITELTLAQSAIQTNLLKNLYQEEAKHELIAVLQRGYEAAAV